MHLSPGWLFNLILSFSVSAGVMLLDFFSYFPPFLRVGEEGGGSLFRPTQKQETHSTLEEKKWGVACFHKETRQYLYFTLVHCTVRAAVTRRRRITVKDSIFRGVSTAGAWYYCLLLPRISHVRILCPKHKFLRNTGYRYGKQHQILLRKLYDFVITRLLWQKES